MLECAQTGDRSGAARREVLQRFEKLEFVVSDAAKGIAKGVQEAAAARAKSAASVEHGLDVFHTNQEARRVLAGRWRQAEAAWQEAEAADAQVMQAKQQGIDARPVAQAARRAGKRRSFG